MELAAFTTPTRSAETTPSSRRHDDPEYNPKQYYYTDAISDHAVRYIRQHHDEYPGKPFFIYVAYTAAHWPMHALDRDIKKYTGKYDAGFGSIREGPLSSV